MNILLPKEVDDILLTFKKHNFEAYVVGGCVRDSIMGISPMDWDIATNATPTNTIALFKKTIPTGIKHGTVTVIINNKSFEVTTFRIDEDYFDSRHPSNVVFSDSIYEDLKRRDFTINAMAYNNEFFIDPFHGKEHIKNNIITCVGNAEERFKEDALRMLRAIRFSCQLNFNIDRNTLNAIIGNYELAKKLSKERLRDEIIKILLTDKPSKGISLLQSTHLLDVIIPSLHNIDLTLIDEMPKNLSLRLSALLYQCKESLENILKDLRFNNRTIKTSLDILSSCHHFEKYKSYLSIKKFISLHGIKNSELILKFQLILAILSKDEDTLQKIKYAEKILKETIENNEPLTIKELKINGSDLIKIGYQEDKELGKTLNQLLFLVLRHPFINSKELLIKIASKKLNKMKH